MDMLNFYSEKDLKRIKESTNYQELLVIACDVLTRMSRLRPDEPIGMISGPISTGGVGSRQGNLKILDRAIKRLSYQDVLMFTQMPFEDDMERIYKSDPSMQGIRLLEEFYQPILSARYIKMVFFVPNWKTSRGSIWEHTQAEKYKIGRIYLPQYYVEE